MKTVEEMEFCNCQAGNDNSEWKYHAEYCPVWKNGRIGELESVATEFVKRCEYHDINYALTFAHCPDLKINETYNKFKELLKQ